MTMRKTHRNYRNYKNRTDKQIAEHKRNFAIFRLRGIEASLKEMLHNDTLLIETLSDLRIVERWVRKALIAETGK